MPLLGIAGHTSPTEPRSLSSPSGPGRVSALGRAGFADGETPWAHLAPDWLNHHHLQTRACWYFPSSSIPLLQILAERLYFIFYFLTLPLICNALSWHCYLHHISYTIFIFFVTWFLHMCCHFARLILFRSIQTNMWVKKNEWKKKNQNVKQGLI